MYIGCRELKIHTEASQKTLGEISLIYREKYQTNRKTIRVE